MTPGQRLDRTKDGSQMKHSLKSAGEIAEEMGLVRRPRTPQAAHHFTRFDQVNQLVGASEADPDTDFMAWLMTLCSLCQWQPKTAHFGGGRRGERG